MKQNTYNWHSMEGNQVIECLNSHPDGLSQKAATERLSQYGKNQLGITKPRNLLSIFFSQFNNLLIYVLIASTIIMLLLNQWVDAGVIFGVILINAVIGCIQENRAEKALDAIRQLLAPTANVIRNNQQQTIAAEQLVPGDIIILEPGDLVPADCRLIESKNLQTQEAILTGESQAVYKTKKPVAKSATVSKRLSMAYAGTFVTYGRARAVIVATGTATEVGKIGKLLQETKRVDTPLLRKMKRFTKILTSSILIAAVLMLILGIFWRHYTFNKIFIAAVAFAVAAIPEGLPPVMTITLALGMRAMVKVNAIIRRLPAVESLGSVTVICTDKTGTLTRNEMMVKKIVTRSNSYNVTGSGYIPTGHIETTQHTALNLAEDPELRQAIIAGICCNEATLYQENDEWKFHGDPTEAALLILGSKTHIDWQQTRNQYNKLDTIPFSSEQRFMASLHSETKTKKTFVFVKGAPERILQMCGSQQSFWLQASNSLASEGLRVIAIAAKDIAETSELDSTNATQNLTFIGLFGMIDSPRPEAITAVSECQSAGIRVKMVTGDHAATALSIAHQVGIDTSGGVITGEELDTINDKDLINIVNKSSIFARTTPTNKIRLIKALQSQQHIVAMTGDGVNDAPALKAADVGIAMGIKGTETAKEAAEIVLADDNFVTIVKAIRQGRRIYSNLIKAIFYILPTSIGEALAIILAILLDTMLPITPLQILWINMVTAVTLAISLAFEKEEKNSMKKPPRNPKETIFRPFLIWRISYVSLLMVAGAYGLFWWQQLHGVNLTTARSVAVNAIVAFEIAYLINSRNLLGSTLNWQGVFGNRMCLIAIATVIALQLLFTYSPSLQYLFSVAALNSAQWLIIILFAFAFFLLVEFEKYITQKIILRRTHHV